jgi:hypothetical protein
MGNVERVLFIHPPQADVFLPPLGPACLMAFLKQHRPDVSYRFLDLNVDYTHWLLAPAQISTALHACTADFERLRHRPALDGPSRRTLQAYLTTMQTAQDVLEAPRPLAEYLVDADIVRDRQTYHVPKSAMGHILHLHALTRGQTVANPEKMIWAEHGIPAWDSAPLLDTLAHPDADPYTPFATQHPQLGGEIQQCDVLCVSAMYYEQMLGAFSTAAFAKRLRPELPVLMGGSWITAIRDYCRDVPELFDYVDAIIPYAGEASLLEAIQRLDRGNGLSGSANAMTRRDGRVVGQEVANFPRIEHLPAPDFDAYALERYFLPAPVLPFQLTRGCYWGQCTFCTHHMAQGLGYSVARTTSIGDKLAYLAERYQSSRFYFVDEAIPPAKLREIPTAIRDQQLDLQWMSECRLERSLDRQAFDQLAASGCRLLLFGLETGSQRVMDLMKKGTRIADARRCLRDCAEAGIYTGLFLMFGFPTETLDDALETYRFVHANRPWIDNIGTSVFTLTAESPIAANPAAFGVTIAAESFRGKPLKEDLAYHVSHGLQHAEAEQVTRWLEQTSTFQDILQSCPFPRRSHAVFVPARHEGAGQQAALGRQHRIAPDCATVATLHRDIDGLRQRFPVSDSAARLAANGVAQPGKMHQMFAGVERLSSPETHEELVQLQASDGI